LSANPTRSLPPDIIYTMSLGLGIYLFWVSHASKRVICSVIDLESAYWPHSVAELKIDRFYGWMAEPPTA